MLEVILAKLIFVVQLQDVLQFLIGHKAILIFVNRSDCLHDLHQLVICSDSFDNNFEISQWHKLLRVLLHDTVICAKVTSRIYLIQVLEVI